MMHTVVIRVIYYFCANYDISLTWIKAAWGWFPLLTMIIVYYSEIAVRLLFSLNKGYQKEPGRSLANYDHVLPLISSQFASTWVERLYIQPLFEDKLGPASQNIFSSLEDQNMEKTENNSFQFASQFFQIFWEPTLRGSINSPRG